MRFVFLFALMVFLSVALVARAGDKVVVCHVSIDETTGIDESHYIDISVHALDAHLAHGDSVAPDGAVVGDPCTP